MSGVINFNTYKYFGPEDKVATTLFFKLNKYSFMNMNTHINFDVGIVRTTSDIFGSTFAFLGLSNEFQEHSQINKITHDRL